MQFATTTLQTYFMASRIAARLGATSRASLTFNDERAAQISSVWAPSNRTVSELSFAIVFDFWPVNCSLENCLQNPLETAQAQNGTWLLNLVPNKSLRGRHIPTWRLFKRVSTQRLPPCSLEEVCCCAHRVVQGPTQLAYQYVMELDTLECVLSCRGRNVWLFKQQDAHTRALAIMI